jgi:hypothetical protein
MSDIKKIVLEIETLLEKEEKEQDRLISEIINVPENIAYYKSRKREQYWFIFGIKQALKIVKNNS